MHLVSDEIREMDPSMPHIVCVGLAMDSGIMYAAIVDTKTRKNYVEEVSMSSANVHFTGTVRKLENDEEWRRVSDFFNRIGVFERFYNGKNWRWKRSQGKDSIPKKFKDKFNIEG